MNIAESINGLKLMEMEMSAVPKEKLDEIYIQISLFWRNSETGSLVNLWLHLRGQSGVASPL